MRNVRIRALPLAVCVAALAASAAFADPKKNDRCPAHSDSQVGKYFHNVCTQTIITYQQMQLRIRRIEAAGARAVMDQSSLSTAQTGTDGLKSAQEVAGAGASAAAEAGREAQDLIRDAERALSVNAKAIERMQAKLKQFDDFTSQQRQARDADKYVDKIATEMIRLEGALEEHRKVMAIGKDVYVQISRQQGVYASQAAAISGIEAKLAAAVAGMQDIDVTTLPNYDPATNVGAKEVELHSGSFDKLPDIAVNGGQRLVKPSIDEILRGPELESIRPQDFNLGNEGDEANLRGEKDKTAFLGLGGGKAPTPDDGRPLLGSDGAGNVADYQPLDLERMAANTQDCTRGTPCWSALEREQRTALAQCQGAKTMYGLNLTYAIINGECKVFIVK